MVWYHREAAEGEPPAEAMQVMKLIVDKQVPISLCSKADFSDYVDRKGVSHPRYTTWDGVVAKVREMTAGGRYVGIIRPDRSYLLIAPPLKGFDAGEHGADDGKAGSRHSRRAISVRSRTRIFRGGWAAACQRWRKRRKPFRFSECCWDWRASGTRSACLRGRMTRWPLVAKGSTC